MHAGRLGDGVLVTAVTGATPPCCPACILSYLACTHLPANVLLGQVFNGLGLLLISMHPRFATHRFAGPAIAAGGFLFSSSIVALVLARDK